MGNEIERCPQTGMLVRECAHCRDKQTRANARYVITVGLRKRGANQPRTIHDPDCWHATNDSEPPAGDWPSTHPGETFTIPPEVWRQDEEHREWESTGRLKRRTVTRADLQPGPSGTVTFQGDSYKRCQRCAPDIS